MTPLFIFEFDVVPTMYVGLFNDKHYLVCRHFQMFNPDGAPEFYCWEISDLKCIPLAELTRSSMGQIWTGTELVPPANPFLIKFDADEILNAYEDGFVAAE